MKVRPESLAGQCRKSLLPLYLIAGDEPLQASEAADVVRAAAREQGFVDREVLFAERGFDWSALAEAAASLSLFASRRLLELRLPTVRPGREGGKSLAAYAAAPAADTLLLVTAPKLDKATRNTSWFKALDKAGAVVEVWPVKAPSLPGWIVRRARGQHLELTDDAASLLAERVEGNLLAAAQEINKLALAVGTGRVDLATARQAVASSARYDVFALTDAALDGAAARALVILDGLKAEGFAPTLVAWALVREIRSLATAGFEVSRGRSATQALATVQPAWRRPRIETALRRLGRRASARLLGHAAQIDRIIKGSRHDEAWPALTELTVMLAGARPVEPVKQGRAA